MICGDFPSCGHTFGKCKEYWMEYYPEPEDCDQDNEDDQSDQD